MDDRRQRLDQATRRRDQLRAGVARTKGRLDRARAELAEVEKECLEKGVDPDKLDTTITRLTERYDQELDQLETSMAEAEKALQPFIGED